MIQIEIPRSPSLIFLMTPQHRKLFSEDCNIYSQTPQYETFYCETITTPSLKTLSQTPLAWSPEPDLFLITLTTLNLDPSFVTHNMYIEVHIRCFSSSNKIPCISLNSVTAPLPSRKQGCLNS